MNRFPGAALALTLALLAGNVQAQTLSRSLGAPPIDVTVVDGAIRVSQASIRTGSGTATVSWQLSTEGYRFTSGSIDFGSAQAYFSCSTANYGQTIRCTKSADAPSGQLSYTIRLSDGQSMVELPQPSVFIQID
ncbi:MAG: hypothetical protein Q8K45_14330 [Rubrivivax sp.]|nr:hypothetical protein [Rubrivivax sp.]